ncbi:hypothetical protein M2271_003518 [Streptomyces sp. LBL]|nr:hypothetical protein [Streptomyces sp. LBL]
MGQCQGQDCGEAAVIGRWCPGHAVRAYRREAVRPTVARKVARVVARTCAAGHGCRFPAVGDDLCGRHSRQMERRGRTTPIAQRRPRGAASERNEQGRKQCSVCLTWQALTAYAASPAQADGLQPRCKGCARFAACGVTPGRYAALLEAQRGMCAVCERPDPAGKDLVVDHGGKYLRGLLCSRCRMGVGRLGNSAERATTAAEYLRTWSAGRPKAVSPLPPAPRDRRWYAFKLTRDEYAAKVEAQSGGCAVCGHPPGVRALAVDHDHACCPLTPTCGRCTRGLLCANCNIGIGLFDEDAARLGRVVSYLSGALTSANAFR